MIPSVVCFFAGISTVFLLKDFLSLRLLAAALSFCLLLSLFQFFRKLKIHWLIIYVFGLFWASLALNHYFLSLLPKSLESQVFILQGRICSLPEKINPENKNAEIQYRFELDVKQSFPNTLWPNPGKIRLYFSDPPEKLQVGDEWQFSVKLKRPHTYANPGSYDKERQFFLNRLTAEGSVVSASVAHKLKSDVFSYPIDRIRQRIQENMFDHLKNSPYAGILTALVVGGREGITEAQWAVFRATGTAHLMAISGLHVGLVAGFAILLMGFLIRLLPAVIFNYIKIPTPLLTAFFALFFALFYALLAGFTVPTKRAFIMLTVLMGGTLCRRRFSIWRCYCLGLFFVLLFDPFSILSVGFWLSFGAVGMIIYGMQNRIHAKTLWWRFGRAQWVVFLGLAPLSLLAFQQTSLIAPVANLIAIPYVGSLVVPFVLIGGLFAPLFPALSSTVLSLASYAFHLLWQLLFALSQFPFAEFRLPQASSFSLILAWFGVFLLLAPKGLPLRSLGMVFLLPLCLNQPKKPEQNTASFTVLEVGQGLASVIETANHILVFDTGPKYNAKQDMGKDVLIPFLESRNSNKIDMLVISHGDNDHIGGAESLLKRYPVQHILTSEPEKISKKQTLNCQAGQKWQWDGVEFEMLHPKEQIGSTHSKRNNQSCVLRVRTAYHSVLLTGDIEAAAENELISKGSQKLSSDILLMPHHGSNSSSTPEFVQAVHPRYAIVSAGYKNAHGHPRPEIVARYQNQGASVLETSKEGAINFILDENPTLSFPSLYRKQKPFQITNLY